MTVTLAMIVRDEEGVLARCLDAAAPLAEEIVILDTGSTDKTLEIARRYTDRVFESVWEDDFAAARNLAFSKATGDYILWLDADDVIPAESAACFFRLKERLARERPDTVMCPYVTGGLRYERERVVKRCQDAKWRGHVHECIAPFGKIIHDEFTVVHMQTAKDRSWRNLRIYQKWAETEPLAGRDLFYYGRELFYHKLYAEAEAILETMLAGAGWYVNKIAACEVLADIKLAQKDPTGALEALFSSFLYGEPRAFILYKIGEIFKGRGEYRTATYWFEQALTCSDHTKEGDFERPDCRGILPTLELVWLYHVLNEPAKSLAMHKKSEALAPDHPSVLFNQKFFGE